MARPAYRCMEQANQTANQYILFWVQLYYVYHPVERGMKGLSQWRCYFLLSLERFIAEGGLTTDDLSDS